MFYRKYHVALREGEGEVRVGLPTSIMRKKIDKLLSLVIIGILLPLFITIISQRMQLEQVIYGDINPTEDTAQATEDLEEQVIGIVAKEISVDMDRDAICAQCVIARTNLCDAKEKGMPEPEALSQKEMQTLWGENYDTIYQELQECVADTKNQVLMWEGDYIYAAYHAVSAGRTRDMAKLYEDAKMPYLKEQLCKEDAVAEGYLAVNYWGRDEFIEKCGSLFPESVPQSMKDIVIISRDETGYVEEISVGGKSYTGEEFRNRFELNSACFSITELEDQVRIVTKGLGHGFGLSQNMANCMAEEGQSYKEILAYFYPETELKEVSSPK